jgi:hypothetical protein
MGCVDGGPLSHQAFVDRANEICRETSAQAGQVRPPEGTSTGDPQAWLDPLDRVIGLYEDALVRLRQLRPPEDDRPGVERALAEIEVVVSALRRARAAAADGDLEAMQASVAEAGRLIERSGAFFRTYGALDCAGAAASQ